MFMSKQMPSPIKNQLLDYFAEQILKILKLKIDALGYPLNIHCQCGQVNKHCGQIIWSPMSHLVGGGWGGVLRSKR
jgi:hypothetical protein